MAEPAPPALTADQKLLAGEVCRDVKLLADKQKVMEKQKVNSLFYSVSDTFKFLSAVLVPLAMMMIGTAVKKATDGVAGAPETIGGAIMGETTGLAVLGAAAVATGVAVGSNYIASHFLHSAQFDQSEANALHTAKYIMREIHKEKAKEAPAVVILAQPQMQMQAMEFNNPPRKDGKTWEHVVTAQAAAKSQALEASPAIA